MGEKRRETRAARRARLLDAATTAAPATNAPGASIFTNLDFEDVDTNGVPNGWTCECQTGPATCQTDTTSPAHGKRELVLPSGCYAYQIATAFDATKGVRFHMVERGGVVMPADTVLFGGRVQDTATKDALYTDGLPQGATNWAPVRSRGSIPTATATRLVLIVNNGNGEFDATPGPNLDVDDIHVEQDGPNPPPKVGSLLRADHVDEFGLAASAQPTSIYLSLPSDWASQVPLYLSPMDVSPPGIVQGIAYKTESEGNWGATITFAPTAGVPNVVLRWHSVVLTRAVPEAELPEVFAARTAPTTWLGSSGCIESNDPGIAGTAAGLVPAGSTALAQMLGVIGWTSPNLTYGFDPTIDQGLDATSAYDTGLTTCTGYANLGAAMSRSIGLPGRHVTNVLVGESQDLHSIDEFYLGDALGWRRVEPQLAAPRVPDDYGFIMRIVQPSDESPVPNRNAPGGPLMLGIPFHEFSENLTNSDAVVLATDPPRAFYDCSQCPNRSDPLRELRDVTPDAMRRVFARAKESWRRALGEYERLGQLSACEDAARHRALAAKTIEDVQSILDEAR
jgi:hypothetical protein